MLQLTLKVVGGEMEATEIPVHLPAIIGRGRDDVALVVPHPLVSRRHCELRDVAGQVWIRDLDSLNGTFVGSERIGDARVNSGELLTVGTVTFRVLYKTASALEPRPARLTDQDDTTRAVADTLRVDAPASPAHQEAPQ